MELETFFKDKLGLVFHSELVTSATTDQVEWFASLTMDQAGHIQTWWDLEGERDWATT